MEMMPSGLLSWIVMGLLAGVLARLLMPRRQGSASGRRAGCVVTMLLGIAGAILGGFLSTILGFGGLGSFDLRSLVVATLGALLILLLARLRG